MASGARPAYADNYAPLLGKRFLVAKELQEAFLARLGAKDEVTFYVTTYDLGQGSRLEGAIARHPMHALGGFFAVRARSLLPDHVTTDAGTGLVHMAPDHGEEDFIACKKLGIDPVFAVDDGGFYRPDWLWLGGQGSVINTKFNGPDGPILTDLREVGALLSGQRLPPQLPA